MLTVYNACKKYNQLIFDIFITLSRLFLINFKHFYKFKGQRVLSCKYCGQGESVRKSKQCKQIPVLVPVAWLLCTYKCAIYSYAVKYEDDTNLKVIQI